MITTRMDLTLGEAFEILRKRKDWSIVEAAKESGLNASVVEGMETCDEGCTLDDAIVLAGAYGFELVVRLSSRERLEKELEIETESTTKERENDDGRINT